MGQAADKGSILAATEINGHLCGAMRSGVMPTNMREFSWRERDRNSQIAKIMYPNLADPTTQKQMLARASEDGRPQNAERLRQRMEIDKPKPNRSEEHTSELQS